MTRRRLRYALHLRSLALGLMGTFAVLLLAAACSSTSNAVGPGGECFLATDCAPGLICIPRNENNPGERICSDDLTSVAGRTPPEGGMGDAGDEAGEGGLVDQDSAVGPDVITPPPDTGVPDTNVPPPDTGSPPVDSGSD